jgi:hypothetical protein
MGAIAGMNEMGVAIDEARRDPAPLAIDSLANRAQTSRQFALRPRVDDALALDRNGAALDRPKPGPVGRKGCEAGVAQNATARPGFAIKVWQRNRS